MTKRVESEDRGASSNLRGRLSEVYLASLCSGEVEPLLRRLGERAGVDDPLYGRASGAEAVAARLAEVARWLRDCRAEFERTDFILGSDRDVTEGVLTLRVGVGVHRVPVAVVAERRPEREVEIRVYHSTRPWGPEGLLRGALVPEHDEEVVPPPVAAYIAALGRGDADALMSSFEEGAALQDEYGAVYVKEGAQSALRGYFSSVLRSGGGASAGVDLACNARADDGRSCAIEWTLVGVGGLDVTPQAGLAVFVRGETGLLNGLRLYGSFSF